MENRKLEMECEFRFAGGHMGPPLRLGFEFHLLASDDDEGDKRDEAAGEDNTLHGEPEIRNGM
jgi:hypothetical protein